MIVLFRHTSGDSNSDGDRAAVPRLKSICTATYTPSVCTPALRALAGCMLAGCMLAGCMLAGCMLACYSLAVYRLLHERKKMIILLLRNGKNLGHSLTIENQQAGL